MDSLSSPRFLRHTVATLAYRAGKTLRGAPEGFASFRPAETVRTPGEILAHLGDLLDWAVSLVQGEQVWRDSPEAEWEPGSARFFAALEALDRELATRDLAEDLAEKLFQGPIADALTHVGQIAMLRRMANAPIRGENFFRARIEAGRVGADQPEPARQF